MKRDLSVERLYFLGQFKNIKFTDTIKDIPEELALDKDFISRLGLLQLIETEQKYYKYIEIGKLQERDVHTQEDVNAMLEDQKVALFEDLKSIINGELTEDTAEDEKEE